MAKEHLSPPGGPLVSHVKVGQYRVKLPKSRVARQALGGGLVAGSALAVLPVFGLWMLPAGLLVLSVDSARVRRFRRVQEVKVVRWWRARQAASKPPS
ncbi:MAG: hypothetical protein HOP13_08495 [Alphaproteobacteria bacterium]|nr:hypothetical protein [Alphaproteobacteria bacterium]